MQQTFSLIGALDGANRALYWSPPMSICTINDPRSACVTLPVIADICAGPLIPLSRQASPVR